MKTINIKRRYLFASMYPNTVPRWIAGMPKENEKCGSGRILIPAHSFGCDLTATNYCLEVPYFNSMK